MNPSNERSVIIRRGRIRDYAIVDTNADNIGGCSLCGNKNASNVGYRRKINWLRERYPEGLRYKVLRSEKYGDIGMIEYALGQHAWRPVEAKGYMIIHCLMVNGKHKGKGFGSLLLESCVRDAKRSKCRGVAVVTSSDSFMAKRDLFIKAGFVPVDRIAIDEPKIERRTSNAQRPTSNESNGPLTPTLSPSDGAREKPSAQVGTHYELLVKKFKKTAPGPRFIVERGRLLKRYRKGLTILAADQCPYVIKTAERIAAASRRLGLEPKVVRVGSAKASRELPTPYGVFSIIYDGRLIAERPISATRFMSIMRRNG